MANLRLSLLIAPVLVLFSCVQPEPSRYADGMLRAVPENEGVSSHNILDFVEEIDNQELELHSFMLIRHNRVLAEGYWSPYNAEMPHLMNSVSKTLTSTAIGFAVKEKLLKVDDKVISFFPDDLPAVISPHLEKLTIKHLLIMSVGQEPVPSFPRSDENWVKQFLATPIVHEPGKVFAYSSYASYMLSAIIHKVSGESTFSYLKTRLFDPLNIQDITWETDSRGISCGGWGVRMKTSDMAKIGKLYLQNGKWNKKQLLPESWIKEATAVHIYQIEEATFEQEMHDEGAQGYGYQIWRCTHNAYRADGAKGQLIVVMPDQDAILVTTGRVADMRKILTVFWERLFPGIFPRMIKRDDAGRGELRSKLASLQLKDPFLTEDEEFVYKDMAFAYKMEENEMNIRELSFQFNERGDCQLTMSINDTPYTFNFGLDYWLRGETEKPGPYFLNARRNPQGLSPFSIAGFGSWTNQNELKLHLRYMTDIEYETFVCKFGNKKIELTVGNSAQTGTVTINGYL